ncbi:MAG: GAF domain-containing protein [Bacteriovorax sp.]|nr:GAF domain-containing protein [Bacteriovorax sp.]
MHPNEGKRIEALKLSNLLDTQAEAKFDFITNDASKICGCSIALISLIDEDRQWFKSKIGLDLSETKRDVSFCSHAILQDDIFEIPNAREDERFCNNPLVVGDPQIRFYAGAPIIWNGLPLGTLCVIDKKSKKLSFEQRFALKLFAHQIAEVITLRNIMLENQKKMLILNQEKNELRHRQLKVIGDVKSIKKQFME